MAEAIDREPSKQLLDRMPGAAWSLRVHPGAGKLEWLYVNAHGIAQLYDVSEAAIQRDPMAMMERVEPEDRARFERLCAGASASPARWSWTGRVVTRTGELRWIEMETAVEAEASGSVRWSTLALDATVRQREKAQIEAELEGRNEQLARSEETVGELAERLRVAMEEMSNPILEVWEGVLAMPIVGLVDARRTADMAQRLLAEVSRTQASFVIVDLTGVEGVDTKTADHLMRLMRKIEVIGARCLLTGIQPAVAETLVDLGIDFGSLTTLRNLKHALREALNVARREREELGADGDQDETSDEDEEPKQRR
jgi:anti-anti-sigma regulatory factor